jgi:release factor glutamine methyltransferase
VPDLIARLRAAGCVAAEEEAALLRTTAPDGAALEALVRRREMGEPIAWLVGWTDFRGARVVVHPGVYVPRPQTEELAHRASSRLPAGGRLVDLCAGSGAIAAWVRWQRPDADVVAVDCDARAAACSAANNVLTVQASAALAPLRSGCADVVTAVAPYVPTDAIAYLTADVRRHEPRLALDGGHDGLTVVRAVVDAARRLLRTGGWLLLEVGGEQDVALPADLHGFDAVESWRDDDGDLRGLVARLGLGAL